MSEVPNKIGSVDTDRKEVINDGESDSDQMPELIDSPETESNRYSRSKEIGQVNS